MEDLEGLFLSHNPSIILSTQPCLLLCQLLHQHIQKHGNTDKELFWTAGEKSVVNYDSFSPANFSLLCSMYGG